MVYKLACSLLMLSLSFSSIAQSKYGIQGEKAPEWNIEHWIDASGDKTTVSLEDYKGKVVVILCYQHWCPGCHSHAFPSLNYLVDRYKNNTDVQFLAIQTVFEGKSTNTLKKIKKTQKKYDLKIPFGHDDGSNTGLSHSSIMQNYKTGGTPWFIIIDKNGIVTYNNYDLDIQQGRRLIKKALQENQ